MAVWQRASNYGGPDWSGYFVASVQTRDSEALDRSNFRVALRELESVADFDGAVRVVRDVHWACGWVEWIAVHPDARRAWETAERLEAELLDYPVLDEDDFDALEREEAQSTWGALNTRERIDVIAESDSVSVFAARHANVPAELIPLLVRQ